MDNYAETVLIGASAFSAGFVTAYGKSCVVLEPSILIASEFSASFRNIVTADFDALSAEGKKLKDEAVKRNILNDKKEISIIPMSGMLAERFMEKEVPLLLNCAIESIEYKDGEYTVSWFGIDGMSSIRCKYVIDTTSAGVLCGNDEEYTKKLRAMLCSALGSEPDVYAAENYTDEGIRIIRGRFKGEYVFEAEIPRETGFGAARELLVRKWERAMENGLSSWRIASISSYFDYEYKNPVCKRVQNYYRIPSSSYGDVFEAFEGGLSCSITQ